MCIVFKQLEGDSIRENEFVLYNRELILSPNCATHPNCHLLLGCSMYLCTVFAMDNVDPKKNICIIQFNMKCIRLICVDKSF